MHPARARTGFVLLAAVVAASLHAAAGFGSAAGAQTFTVGVDGDVQGANETFIDYFPHQTTVHAGDTVVFAWHGPGEPHTVTLGTLVDRTVSVFDKLTPKQLQAPQPPKALAVADGKLPQLLPQGPGDAIQSGANPCFVANGTPPLKSACPSGDRTQAAFDGKQAYYNSGWRDPGEKFTVHVAGGTTPGTYSFMCLLHREGMIGKLKVVSSSTQVPSPAAQAATGEKEKAALEAKLAPGLKLLRQGKPPIPFTMPAGASVLAGSGSADPNVEAAISEFGPRTVSIPVGGSVTWWLIGAHSITFNANKSDDDIRAVAPDGSVHLNPKAIVPANSPGEPSKTPTGGSPTRPKLAVVASKAWNGKGFLNSGVFANSFGPPLIEGYKLTFTRAGTYHYLCTVHDHMKGTVVVHG